MAHSAYIFAVDGKQLLAFHDEWIDGEIGDESKAKCEADSATEYKIFMGNHGKSVSLHDWIRYERVVLTFPPDFETLTDYECEHFTVCDESLEIQK